MQLSTRALRHPWALLAAICVVLGFATGWFAGRPESISANSVAQATWNLPDKSTLERYHGEHFAALIQSKAWQGAIQTGTHNGAGDNAPGQDQNAPWTLLGLVTSPQPFALVLAKGTSDVQRLANGAKLPGGAVIKHITHNAIDIATDKCLQRLSLYPSVATTVHTNCLPAASSSAPGTSAGETHD